MFKDLIVWQKSMGLVKAVYAFAAGCPVLLANDSFLPEVAGNAALYFAPEDMASLREQLAQLLHDASLRDRLMAQSHSRLKGFSWSSSAEETANVYRSMEV